MGVQKTNGSEGDIRHSTVRILKLLSFKALLLLFLILLWQIEEQQFDWATAQDFTVATFEYGWLVARFLNMPPASDIASLMIAAIAFMEARLSTSRIIRLLERHNHDNAA